MTKYFLNLVTIVTACVMLSACGSSRKTASTGSYKPSGQGTVIETSALPATSKALVSEAKKWLGTPYKYGGNDSRGIDCSGLVLQVYSKALDISLPRNSRAQHDYCSPSSKGGLVPGDLLFFATGKDKNRVSHVGIFVGGNSMIHASASKGVIVSDFTEPYYERTFAGARYVGEYHAMLEPAKKPKKPKRERKRKDSPEPETDPIREPAEVQIAKVESPAGFSLTPVESLPTRSAVANAEQPATQTTTAIVEPEPEVTAATAQPAPQAVTAEPEDVPQQAAVAEVKAKPQNEQSGVATATTPVVPSVPQSAEPSAAEARNSVLNSLTERPLN